VSVVYLYRGAGVSRIPFNISAKRIFSLKRHDGIWDEGFNGLIFKRNVDAAKLSRFLDGSVLVQVEENSSGQPKVFGFFDRPWEAAHWNLSLEVPYTEKPVNPRRFISNGVKESKEHSDSPFIFPAPPSPPEKFCEYWRSKLETELRSRKYSPQTRRAYIYYNRLICRFLQKTPEEIRSDDVTQFIASMDKDGGYSASAMNIAISAIKFFFRNVLKSDEINDRHRPHQDGRLPMVLSKEEIAKVLSVERNPKHRLLLMLVYSSGLRVSEVVALKKEHIDLSRKVIYIRLGKGRKDRSTLLSEKAAGFIEEYYDFFGIEKWLFPGCSASRHLSIRSAQHIFDKAIRRAGIEKEITIHGLRHTFATHLLESGTDIRYIQSLLGHSSLRTTERYTHIARRSVLNIKSPLDTIP
jgi:site-specific recombinase XerD